MARKTEPLSAAPTAAHVTNADPVHGLQSSLDGLDKLSKTLKDALKRGPLALLGLLCLGATVYGGQLILRDPAAAWRIIHPAGQSTEAASAAAPDLFPEPQTLFVVYHNADGTLDGDPQKWVLHIHGTDTFTGDVELPEQHKKGTLSGFRRDGVVTLNYASEKATGHGFGTFYLTPRNPADATKGDVWAGLAVFHDCTTQDQVVCTTLRVGAAAAMMSAQADNVDNPNNTYYRTFTDTILTRHLGWTPDQLTSSELAAKPVR